jgi:biopolymer transport protein ExbB
MKRHFFIVSAIVICALLGSSKLVAADNVSLDELLKKVKDRRVQDAQENAARLAAFKADKSRQQQLLGEAKVQRSTAEARSDALEIAFEENDVKVVELELALKERLGSLKELFGVLLNQRAVSRS